MAYEIQYVQSVLDKIDTIHDYIADVLQSPSNALGRVEQIFNEIDQILLNPLGFPSADEKLGVQVDKRHDTHFSIIVDGKYLVLFFVDDENVVITHLLPTSTDYMSLFRGGNYDK